MATVPAAARRPSRRLSARREGRPLWMLAPGGILMVVVIVVPLVIAAIISLLDLDQYTLRDYLKAPFIGLANYLEALGGPQLLPSIGISVSFAVIVAAVSLPIGVLAALATQNAFRGRAAVRSLFIIPYVIPAFVMGQVWRTLLLRGGVVDHAFGVFGIHPGLWLNGPQAYGTLVVVQLWTSWPFAYLLILAGLQSVDHDVHEASALDGAGWWSKLWLVIFPYLRGPAALAVVILFLHNFNAFTLPYVLFGVPAPHNVDVLTLLTYSTSFQSFRFGLAAAIAVFSLVILAIPLVIYLRAVRLDVGDQRAAR